MIFHENSKNFFRFLVEYFLIKYKTLTNFFAMLDYLERAKTRQNVEVFMMKFLEAKYGASYFINAANSVM